MLKKAEIKPVLLFPFAIPAIISYIMLSQDAKEKVKKDILMYWTHTIGEPLNNIFKMWLTLLTCNDTFRNVYYCRFPNIFRIVLPVFLKPHSSLHLNPALSKYYGGGLYIAHGDSIRIGADGLGENAWIHQNVTVGMKGEYRPIIGKNVYIGCGAVIIGKSIIGDNCKIGANAVVVDMEIPDNSTVCGPKARIVKTK